MAKTTNIYAYPVNQDEVTNQVTSTTSGSHTGAYEGSIDFATPLGTEVFAAADGIVQRVRDDSDKYGKTPDFGPDANYITIKHPDNELSEYLHIAKGSATVKVGEHVKSGQGIAKTGLSGWLFEPHLHFMVYKTVTRPEDFQCLQVRFAKSM